MQRDAELKAAVAADADVFQMFRARSDADLAAVGLRRVPTAGEADMEAMGGVGGHASRGGLGPGPGK